MVGDRLSASDTRRERREQNVASGSKCGRCEGDNAERHSQRNEKGRESERKGDRPTPASRREW